MSDGTKSTPKIEKTSSGRRAFLYTVFGGVLAAFTGWIAGVFPRESKLTQEAATQEPTPADGANRFQPLAQMEGEWNQRVIFNKSELSIINPGGVLLNLVATHGHVGIRFYKDFDFGNEQETSPWHMGYIEGVEGYQGLAILRDWRFTAALWDEDGKLLLGRLHSHPPANEPARARLHVRGTVNEVQAIVEGSAGQTADIFQVLDGGGSKRLAVNSAGQIEAGSRDDPKGIILHDTQNSNSYSLNVTNGQLTLTRI
jgi:hypothetical protein